MSRIVLLLLLTCFGFTATAQAQYSWTTVPSGTHETLTTIKIYQPNEVVIVGFNGTILVSTDYGHTFTARNASNQNLYGIVFLSANTFIVGGNNIILKTTDAGITWKAIDEPGFAVRCMTMDSAGILYATGSYSGASRLMTSQDSGETWQVANAGVLAAQLYPVITTGHTVFTSGVDGRVFYTVDHGKSFSLSPNIAPAWIRAGAAVDDQAWVVGESGVFGRSTDGGVSWTYTNLLGSTSLQAVAAHGDVVFVVTDQCQIALSIDGGSSWIATYSSEDFPDLLHEPLHGVDFFGPNLAALVVGNNGVIMRRGPDTVVVTPTPSDTAEWRVAKKQGVSASRQLSGMCLARNGLGIGVGIGGTVHRTTDAGRSWQCDSVGVANYIACSYVSPLEWYVFSYQSRDLLHSADSGQNWFLEVAPTEGQIMRATSNGHTMVAVGQYTIGHGLIYMKHAGGIMKIITEASSGGSLPELNLVAFLGNDRWIAKGRNNASYILSSDDGDTWSVVADADSNVKLITALSALDGKAMAGSEIGRVGYLDANNGWIFGSPFIPSNMVVGVAGAQSVGFAADVSGRIYRTTETPYTWRRMTTPTPFQLVDIHAVDSAHAVAYGYSGNTWYYGEGPLVATVKPAHSGAPASPFTLTPNPVSHSATIELDRSAAHGVSVITVQDMLGRTLLRERMETDRYSLDDLLARLSNGHYWISVEANGTRSCTTMVVDR